MKRILLILFITTLSVIFFLKLNQNKSLISPISDVFPIKITVTNISTPSITPTPTLQPLPSIKIIENDYQVFQTFNNCGPAALSMALSYYGINKSQQELGQALRPYQNFDGNNDDKSVTLDELAQKASEYNLIPFHRPNGSIELVKKFIAQDIPVITRTRLIENDDIGHYRVVKGYDDTTGEFIQDDSMQGHNLRYSYSLFSSLWKMFDYEYLVLIPADKKQVAKSILGENADAKISWKNAVDSSRKELESSPGDIYSRFNLSVALYHTGDYQGAVSEFEIVEGNLPFRTLWYQIEPIQTYYELGNYQRVFDITDNIFNNQNRAFSELYIIRGEIYQKQGNIEGARSEFEKAVFYNKNMQLAQQLLQSVQ